MAAAAAQGDADAKSLEKGRWIAQNATQYNKLDVDGAGCFLRAIMRWCKRNCRCCNFEFQELLATATTEHTVGAMVDTLKAKWNLSDAQAKDITDGLKVALAVGLGTAAGALAYKRAIAASKRESPASSRPDVLPPKNGKNVWDLEPRARGRQIETTLTDTDYKDWARTDNLINPKTGQGTVILEVPPQNKAFPKSHLGLCQ